MRRQIQQERMRLANGRDLAIGRDRFEVEKALQVSRRCPLYYEAELCFDQLRINSKLTDRVYDRCYCTTCYRGPEVMNDDGPTRYVVPVGWVRFALKAPPHAEAKNVWTEWGVSFHGTNATILKNIVDCGDILMPGDSLPDGTRLESRNCAGRTDSMVYTSPTVNYAGLRLYAKPQSGPANLRFQVVFQCRQQPGTYKTQAETMGFRKKGWGTILCPHIPITEIEQVTRTRKTIIPYGILVRAYDAGNPPSQFFRSPVDPPAWG